MKKLLNFAIIVLCFAAMSEATGTSQNADIDLSGMGPKDPSYQTTSLFDQESEDGHKITVNCTINIEITLNDGTTVTGEITIMDISWWNCTKLKVVNFLSKVF